MSLQRTRHRNLVTGADLSGSTVHRESRVDLEDHLDPITATRTRALHSPGVADAITARHVPTVAVAADGHPPARRVGFALRQAGLATDSAGGGRG